jgi:hypothetical protein
VPLRPLALSEILDGAFQAIRTNPRTMLGFAAIVLSVTSLLSLFPQAWLQRSIGTGFQRAIDEEDPTALIDTLMVSIMAVLPTSVLTWVALTVLNALLVVAVNAAVLGEKTSPAQLWQQVRGRVPAVLGLSLLTGLIVGAGSLLAAAVVAVPGTLLVLNDQPWVGFPLILLALLPALAVGVTLLVRTALAGPVLLIERSTVGVALRRAWRLVGGSFWRVLGILLLVWVLTSMTSLLIQVPFGAIAVLVDVGFDNPLHDKWIPTLISTAVNVVGQTVSGTIIQPWSAAVVALVYLDLRMRREGLDLELIRAAEARS